MAGTARAPRLARPFVAVFLAAMLAAALFVWEPWPLTSFRLFSHLRSEQESGWTVAALTAGGVAHPLSQSGPFLHLPFQMREFESASAGRRDAVCRAWVRALQAEAGYGQEPEVVVYRVTRSLGRRVDGGERPAPPVERPAYACSAGGARVVGAGG